MKKTFDAVKFQRERRAELSEKLKGMTPKEVVEYFKSQSQHIRKPKKGNTRHRV